MGKAVKPGTADGSASATVIQEPSAWLLNCRIMHERLRPKRHRFVYPAFYVRVDLDRLHSIGNAWFGVDRHRPLSLRRRDHGPCDGSELATWMRAQLRAAGLHEADGRIWLQAFPRVLGYAFNPIAFWFCHDRDGGLRALLAEVRNTFGERHCYLLHAPDREAITRSTVLRCKKVLHVSPFCRVEGGYVFRVGETRGNTSISIDYHDAQGLLIRTALHGALVPLTGTSALTALARQPFLCLGVVFRIHWQALRLAIKKVPFHGKRPVADPVADKSSTQP